MKPKMAQIPVGQVEGGEKGRHAMRVVSYHQERYPCPLLFAQPP
jgi:hypothetical protein